MEAKMYREKSGQVHIVGTMSVIEDRGGLWGPAPRGNKGWVLSEIGAGVWPLVLLGLRHEVLKFLTDKSGLGIDNQFKDLPEIWMGITYYRPGPRYRGLFPAHAVLEDVAGFATNAFGGIFTGGKPVVDFVRDVGSVLGGARDVKEARGRKVYSEPKTKQQETSLTGNELCVEFHYAQNRERTLREIGKKFIGFPEVYKIVLKELDTPQWTPTRPSRSGAVTKPSTRPS